MSHGLRFPFFEYICLIHNRVGRTCGQLWCPREARGAGWGSRPHVGADRMKHPPALARVWLSKKFSPYNQDPKQFAAMLLPSPWVVLSLSRSCGPAGAACQGNIPLQGVCVCPRAGSRGAPVWPHTPTVSLCPIPKPRARLWAQLPPKGMQGTSSGLGTGAQALAGNLTSGNSLQKFLIRAEVWTWPHPCCSTSLASCKRPLVATNFQAGLISFPCWMINSIFSHYFVQIQAKKEDACVWLQAEFGSMSK